MSAHFHNRRRNCYSIAIKGVHRALMYCFRGRRLKRQQFHEDTRLATACSQHGISSKILLEGLSRNEILLNRKALVDLAIWEPRTFKSLAKVAWARCKIDGLNMVKELPLPGGIITRGMLK